MTVSEELREWALYDKRADGNQLTTQAWYAFCFWRGQGNMPRPHGPVDYRTFALLVAEALESTK